MVQLSHPYMTTGKTIALTKQTFVSKVMSLLFKTLSRFVITFLSRSKHLLISRLQSLSTVVLKLKNIKSVTVFIFSPSICHEVMGLHAMILNRYHCKSLTLYTKQKKRHRCIEQTFGLCGRRRGWDVSREQHRNMYII